MVELTLLNTSHKYFLGSLTLISHSHLCHVFIILSSSWSRLSVQLLMTLARKLWNSSLTASESSSRFVCTQVTLDNTEAVWGENGVLFSLNMLQYIFSVTTNKEIRGSVWFQWILQMYINSLVFFYLSKVLFSGFLQVLLMVKTTQNAVTELLKSTCYQEHGTRTWARLNPRPPDLTV